MDYTKRLYDLRIDNDLKQEDVAKVLKITTQAYGMYENKKRSLPIDSLITLCKFYNVTSDYILGLSDDKNR
ncbi:MAG: helix-turn-helix transcriptional regulator [Clostridia bacterium]|nr:helix-turn-helix transcriptional regulator [Clostridia bacterium]